MKQIVMISLASLLFGCISKPTLPDEKWMWSIDRLEKAVNQVRAGKDITPKTWPNGAKVAVLLSFDVDNETVEGPARFAEGQSRGGTKPSAARQWRRGHQPGTLRHAAAEQAARQGAGRSEAAQRRIRQRRASRARNVR